MLSSLCELLQEAHFKEGKMHGVLIILDERGKYTEDTPSFWIEDRQVSREAYLKACQQDPTLPRYQQDEDDRL